MIRDLLERLAARTEMYLELRADRPTDAWNTLRQSNEDPGIRRSGTAAACGDQTGARSGRPTVLMLGSDSPTVPLAHLSALLETTADRRTKADIRRWFLRDSLMASSLEYV
jgi:hypothetical protein